MIVEIIFVDRPCPWEIEFPFPGSLMSTFLADEAFEPMANVLEFAADVMYLLISSCMQAQVQGLRFRITFKM